jgi:hypothetical protein
VWPTDSLRFRYQYTLLPTDLMPRLIVQAHRNLTKPPTRWRNGTVLGVEDCIILIRAEPGKNRVEILIAGPSPRRRTALAIVRNHFEAVHERYARLNVKARVPLPEQPEVDVGYDHLVKLEQRFTLDHGVEPEDAERSYTVRELLEGVRNEQVRTRPERHIALHPEMNHDGLEDRWPMPPGPVVGLSTAAPQSPSLRTVADERRPHVILFVSANPTTAQPLALAEEERAIREELQRSTARDAFVLHTRTAAQPLDLLRALRDVRPAVVHFSGHGGQRGLQFQGPTRQPQIVSGSALSRTFAAAGSSVKVIVLNACYSDDQARLLRAHVDCVIGMSGAIDDDAARSFAVGLHGGFAAHESVAAAFAQGCAAIALDDLPDEDRPRLLVREGIRAEAVILAADDRERAPASIHRGRVPHPGCPVRRCTNDATRFGVKVSHKHESLRTFESSDWHPDSDVRDDHRTVCTGREQEVVSGGELHRVDLAVVRVERTAALSSP